MTTNQAFIKAYRRDAAETAPARPASAPVGKPHRAALGTTVHYVSAAVGQLISTFDQRVPLLASGDQGEDPRLAGVRCAVWSDRSANDRCSKIRTARAPHRSASDHCRHSPRKSERRTRTRHRACETPPRIPAGQHHRFLHLAKHLPNALPTVRAGTRPRCRPARRKSEQGRSLIGMIGLFPNSGTTTTSCASPRESPPAVKHDSRRRQFPRTAPGPLARHHADCLVAGRTGTSCPGWPTP